MGRSTVLTICLLLSGFGIQVEAANNSLGAVDVNHFEGAHELLHYSFEDSPDRPYDGDRDLDNLPDDWSRRKGASFPQYVGCSIDRTRGYESSQSLKIDLNGGNFAIYSPLNKESRINPDYSYAFEGYIRTQNLNNSAAILAVSLLNNKRQRVQRYLSEPVTGTRSDWHPVSMKIIPNEDVKYAIISCHLVNQRKKDIRGTVWFDKLRLGRKPRLDAADNFVEHFKQISNEKIKLNFKIRGLDDSQDNSLHLTLFDTDHEQIDQTILPIGSKTDITWELDQDKIDIGYYQVFAELKTLEVQAETGESKERVIADTSSSFAVMDLISQTHEDYSMKGDFGWSIADDEVFSETILDDLSDIAGQAGINLLKYPVWKNSFKTDQKKIVNLFKHIHAQGITPVGVLSAPPPDLRAKFKADWSGVSEVFNMPRRFWARSLESTIAHLSATVQHWQMGGDEDLSFVGGETLDQTIHNVKTHFDIVGRNTKIGVPWRWESELPDNVIPTNTFLAIKGGASKESKEENFFELSNSVEEINLPPEELYQTIHEIKTRPAPAYGTDTSTIPLWVLLKPLKKSEHSEDERADDLVKRMVAAKRGGADQVCAMDVFSDEYGLMKPTNGSPTSLFLPWRTTALALRNSTYINSFKLNNGSTNHLFERDGEVVMFIWNEEAVEEELFLGDHRRVEIYNVWGQELQPEIFETRHRLKVNSSPLIIRNCSAEMINFQLAVDYVKGKAGGTFENISDGIRIRNPFQNGVRIQLDIELPSKDWKIERNKSPIELGGGEEKVINFRLHLPNDVSVGQHNTNIICRVKPPNSDTSAEPYNVIIRRPYQVGLGDIEIVVINRINKHNQLEIIQKIVNNTKPEEILNFECKLYAPGIKRMKSRVIKLRANPENDINVHKVSYYLSNPESWYGQELRIKAEQDNGRRVLNYKWVVSQDGPEWEDSPVMTDPQARRLKRLQ